MTIVNNVYFAFCKIQSPVEAINKANTELSVQVVMDEDTADSWRRRRIRLKRCLRRGELKSYRKEVRVQECGE